MRLLKILVLILLGLTSFSASTQFIQEKTVFQTASPWRPEMDLRSDVAIVYGMNSSFMDRVGSWKERGYRIHFMTGVAWGEYQDYLEGRFDGVTHHHEAQVDRRGNPIMHGPTVPYMVPTASYIEYLKTLITQAIDGGAEAVHLEEPEFWNRGGYSEGFKQEWQAYYGEPWQAQHTSPDAAYRSAKLKYHLYFRALKELFLHARDTSQSRGLNVKCYVPTHTLINYSAWGIVSPEANLAHLDGMDGYIAQVWTGTARTPTIFRGVEKERTFENAYLEYSSMLAMTRPTGRRVYFLTDPIEDNPNFTWENYKLNYEATFTAQLMIPSIEHYEVMPWPNRIFFGRYQVEGSREKQKIPDTYATQIQVMINALNEVPKSSNQVSGAQGIAVLLSDTMMFQRFPTFEGYEDPRLSQFYGMALPPLKHGIPVELVQMENLTQPDILKDTRCLIMSYANMKPLSPDYHSALANWVEAGGHLIYVGKDEDPYQKVREWWNRSPLKYAAPSEHLFELMNINPKQNQDSFTPFGKGAVSILRVNPVELAKDPEGGMLLMDELKKTLGPLPSKNHFLLQRGAYDIIAVMDESVNGTPYQVSGSVVNLYSPNLDILTDVQLKPNERAFFYNLARAPKAPALLASASRAYDVEKKEGEFSFTLKGPLHTQGVARILLDGKPMQIEGSQAGKDVLIQSDWDPKTQTVLLRYENSPDGIRIKISHSDH